MAPRKRHASGGEQKTKDKIKVKQKENGKKNERYSFGYKLFLVLVIPFVLIVAGNLILKLTDNRTSNNLKNHQEKQPRSQEQGQPRSHEQKQPRSHEEKKPKAHEERLPRSEAKQTDSESPKKKSSNKKTILYEKSSINEYDKDIIKQLKAAKKLLTKGSLDDALNKFTVLSRQHPKSPLARFGKAQALDQLAEARKSNELLSECIDTYRRVPDIPDCPPTIQRQALVRLAERLGFFGRRNQAVQVWKRLQDLFPTDVEIKKSLGVEYLIGGMDKQAKPVFEEILSLEPNNGFAKSHLGFIVKRELNYEESVPLLREGIASREPGATDGRFYFHLGDALVRLGRREEADEVYENGVKEGLFLSALQRSLYNADTPLKAQPWWTPEETPYLKAIRKLEKNWEVIRDEGVALLNSKSSAFVPEDENLKKTGDWGQFTMFQRGQENRALCLKTPRTCSFIRNIPDAAGCKRGQVKFSVMQPGTYVWPHTGPTNCRIRGHLGLVIPKNVSITVGRITKTWEEGKMIIIDDSIEHEVTHNGDSFRLILIVDFWHPELTHQQKLNLTPI